MTSSPDPSNPLHLTIACAPRPQTSPIRDGKVQPEGVVLENIVVDPMIAGFRRMIRDLEFDICEVAITTYTIAREHGYRLIAIPVFVQRQFHHSDLTCRDGSGIKTPKDLEGKRVGVRAYSVTTGVWVRGLLASEYGVDLNKVTWVVDDEEHVETLQLPGNVEHVPAGGSIAQLFQDGDIQAGLSGPAGLGRSGAPREGWETNAPEPTSAVDNAYRLFPNADELDAAWYKKTGVYPIHGVITVKESLIEEHPWLAKSLFEAFNVAKQNLFTEMADPSIETADVKRFRKFTNIVGPDPLPYGIEANRKTLEALYGFSKDQGLLQRIPSFEDVFASVE